MEHKYFNERGLSVSRVLDRQSQVTRRPPPSPSPEFSPNESRLGRSSGYRVLSRLVAVCLRSAARYCISLSRRSEETAGSLPPRPREWEAVGPLSLVMFS